jgi:hypothetical protein
LQSLGRSSVTILWRTATPVQQAIDYGKGQSYDLHYVEPAPVMHHEVTLSPLEPGTVYYYRLREDSTVLLEGPEFTFRTDAGPQEKSFSFFAAGDVGETLPPGQQIFTKNQILKTSPRALFGLLLGDNVYPSGMSEAYDANLMTPWADLLCNTPVWPALGNHDWRVNPDSNFVFEWALPNNEHYYSFDYGNAHFIALDSRDGGLYDETKQLEWLRADLEASMRATWRFVYYHHPYRTCTYKGDLVAMGDQLGPIFDQYRVDAVFNGHAHTYERLYPQYNHQSVDVNANRIYNDPHGTLFIVSGCASKFKGSKDTSTSFCGPTAFYLDNRILFTHVSIYDHMAYIAEIDSYTGEVVDYVVINKSIRTSDLGLAPAPGVLRQNVPNPFNPQTAIPFQLGAPAPVRLGVYRADGTWVATLANRLFPGGAQSVVWNGRDARGVRVASGPYVCRLDVGGRTESIKMMLVQ